MRRRGSILKKIISLALSFAVVLPATVGLIGDSGSAHAVTSLPYVEELKQTGGTFNILEIAPTAASGSIGYYISGQEPCANWATDAAKSANAADKAARKTYVDTLFTSLSAAHMLGSGNPTITEIGNVGIEFAGHDRVVKLLPRFGHSLANGG